MSPSEHDQDPLLAGLSLDDRGGPARRISREQATNMVEQALTTWAVEQAVPPRPTRLFPAVAAAAVVLLAVIGGASAARWYFGSSTPTPAVTVAGQPAAAAQARPSPTLLPAVTLEALPAPESTPESARPSAKAPRDRAEPDDLLQRANQLRAAGRFQSAADTYAQVYERHPRTLSAYAAQIAAASIELEHLGKPQHARKLFESALASQPRGALDLEARQGLSLALRDLGRDRDEAEALRGLIRAHGETPAARRAQARLKELAGDAP
jgi:tetratricopeptide (TPR) repeat protein